MMKKIFLAFLFCIPWVLHAQVTLSVQLPPAGMIQKDQLWNLVIVNNTNNTMDVTVSLNLQDPATGQSVLSAATRSVTLNRGAKMLSITDVQPVQYNYGVTAYAGNFIPLGSYNACYLISKLNGEQQEPVASECVRINISPLSPPILNMPADKATLSTPYPQLTWVAPTPLDMFSDLSYDLSVAEVLQGQSPAEAIINNSPVYSKTHIRVPYENYPSGYSRLERGKLYAWQVTARNGANYAAATEVWTFRLNSDSNQVTAVNPDYLLMKSKNEAVTNYIDEKLLYIKYYSFDKAREVNIRFLDASGSLVQEIKQNIIYGDNFLRFPLSNAYQKGKLYSLEITDLQKRTYSASFIIK